MRFCSTLPLALCALSALSLLVSFFVRARGPQRAPAPAPAALGAPPSRRYESSPSPSSIPSSWHDDVSLVTVNDVSSSWHFNATLAESIRKDVLRFLDPERDMFLLQRDVKPGDRIPYILNRGHLATVTRTLHSLLPSAPLLHGRRFATCALVGNSGILRGSHCGSEIDRHDYVVRCNMAPVTPFKRDVGVRTDFLTMNPSILPHYYGGLRNATLHDRFVARLRALGKGIFWIPAFMVLPERRWVDAVTELIAHEHLSLHPAMPSLRLMHAVRGYWLSNHVDIKRPTTGLLMYTLFTRFCRQIHLYGFWPFHSDTEGRPVPYHYYEVMSYSYYSRSSPHAMPLEFQALHRLHELGALRMRTQACT